MQLFILHKQEHFKVQEQSVDISQYLVTNTSQIISTDETCSDGTQYDTQETFDQTDQLDEPIILEDNNMLFRYKLVYNCITGIFFKCEFYFL